MANRNAQPLRPTLTNTFCGDQVDAAIILWGVLSGRLDHTFRRPHESERESLIRSGNIFVYESTTSGIKRWTDGRTWSPSRSIAPFLGYREVENAFTAGEKKRARRRDRTEAQSSSSSSTDPLRWIRGSLEDSYDFKAGGLIKKTFSLVFNGVSHHLVAYYSIEDVVERRLPPASSDARLADLVPSAEFLNALPLNQSTGNSFIYDDFYAGAEDSLRAYYAPMNRYPNFLSPLAFPSATEAQPGLEPAMVQWSPEHVQWTPQWTGTFAEESPEEPSGYAHEAMEYAQRASAYPQQALEHNQQASAYLQQALPHPVWEHGQQSYALQAAEYNQQASGYPEQAMEYNQQASGYPQQAVEYNQQPSGGYPRQAVEYSQQQSSDYPPPPNFTPYTQQQQFQYFQH